MNKYWSRRLKDLVPYTPGEQPKGQKFIKLNTNENPYPPSENALQAINSAANPSVRLYPDPQSSELREALGDYYKLKSSQIFMGNGSDEILAFCFLAFFNPGEAIVFPDVTYSFYPVYAKLFAVDFRLIPVNNDFALPVAEFCKPNHGVIFPNPNAPTGMAVSRNDIETILKANPDNMVIIDEAYVDFGAESAVPLIQQYPNLLVVHTMSKSRSLAGMRVGYAMGDEGLITALCSVRDSVNSYTMDYVAQKAAVEAVRDTSYFDEICTRIRETRDRTMEKLRELGFAVTPSKANFMFISHNEKVAKDIFAALREKGILVRYFPLPRIDNYLRVTVGTDGEMDQFIQAIGEIIS